MKRIIFIFGIGLLILTLTIAITYNKNIPVYNNELTKINTSTQKILAYQISLDGKKLIYLALENGHLALYSRTRDETVKLVTPDITVRNTENIKPGSADTFINDKGEIFFEADLNLFRVDTNQEVTVYKYLNERLLHSADELKNKSTSQIFKKITDKYSKQAIETIKFSKTSKVTTYLIEVDENYYIDTSEQPLKIDRFLLNEELKTKLPNNQDMITTKIVNELVLNPAKVYSSDLEHLLENNRSYSVENNEFAAKIQKHCYINFLAVDGPSCRGIKIFAKIKFNSYLLPNAELKKKDTNYDSSFIYIPCDKRFFTQDGDFVFLSQSLDLYLIKN